MQTKKIINGVIIFAIVTVITFIGLDRLFSLEEGNKVIIAIALGLAAEFFYRKKYKQH